MPKRYRTCEQSSSHAGTLWVICALKHVRKVGASDRTPAGAGFPAGGRLRTALGSLGATGSRSLGVLFLVLFRLRHRRALKVGVAHPHLHMVRALQQTLVQLPRARTLALAYLKIYVALRARSSCSELCIALAAITASPDCAQQRLTATFLNSQQARPQHTATDVCPMRWRQGQGHGAHRKGPCQPQAHLPEDLGHVQNRLLKGELIDRTHSSLDIRVHIVEGTRVDRPRNMSEEAAHARTFQRTSGMSRTGCSMASS